MSVSTLVDLGADALNNLFEVTFTPPAATITDDKLKFRTQDFTPPNPSIGIYDVHWKNVSIKRPNAKISLDRTLTFNIRIDESYSVYSGLLDWQNKQSNASDSTTSTDILSAGTTGTITVTALKGNSNITWTFSNCWIENIQLSPYSTNGSEPVKATVKFHYGDYDFKS